MLPMQLNIYLPTCTFADWGGGYTYVCSLGRYLLTYLYYTVQYIQYIQSIQLGTTCHCQPLLNSRCQAKTPSPMRGPPVFFPWWAFATYILGWDLLGLLGHSLTHSLLVSSRLVWSRLVWLWLWLWLWLWFQFWLYQIKLLPVCPCPASSQSVLCSSLCDFCVKAVIHFILKDRKTDRQAEREKT